MDELHDTEILDISSKNHATLQSSNSRLVRIMSRLGT